MVSSLIQGRRGNTGRSEGWLWDGRSNGLLNWRLKADKVWRWTDEVRNEINMEDNRAAVAPPGAGSDCMSRRVGCLYFLFSRIVHSASCDWHIVPPAERRVLTTTALVNHAALLLLVLSAVQSFTAGQRHDGARDLPTMCNE